MNKAVMRWVGLLTLIGASCDHIMFGDFSAWYYLYLGGIRLDDAVSAVAERLDPGAVAFKRFIICPEPVQGIGWVKAEHDSPYGMIRSAWRRQGGGLRLEVEGPVNTSATVFLPIRPDVTNVVADVAPTTSDRNRMRFKVGLREIHL